MSRGGTVVATVVEPSEVRVDAVVVVVAFVSGGSSGATTRWPIATSTPDGPVSVAFVGTAIITASAEMATTQAGPSDIRGTSCRVRMGTSSMAAERVAIPIVMATRTAKSGTPPTPMRSSVIQRNSGQWYRYAP